MILAQVPGVDTAVAKAAESGWLAVVVVIILSSFLLALGFIARWFMASYERQQNMLITAAQERENRLSTRITSLEDFIHTTLMDLIKQCKDALSANTASMDRLQVALSDKPCLLNDGHRGELTDRISQAVVDSIDRGRVK